MTNKTLKIDIKLDKLARKVAQANKNEVMQISQEKMNDKTIDEFIKKLEEKSHRDENGIEFWYARQLQEILEYVSWDKFQLPLKKAKNACQDSGIDVDYHFSRMGKMVEAGVATKEINDYKLSRYACYLQKKLAKSKIKNTIDNATKYNTILHI